MIKTNLHQAGIFPHQDLILRIAVGGDKLTGVLGPGQVTNLENKKIDNSFIVFYTTKAFF